MQKTLGERASHAAGPIAATGTLPRLPHIAAPSRARRVQLALEILVIFVGGPLAMTYAIYVARTPLFAALLPVLVGLIAFLLLDRTFSLRRELARGFGGADLASMLAILAVCGGAVALYVAIEMPDRFLSMPRNRFGTWRKVLTVYPFLSVLVQEFVYRTFFFHRYGPLFGSRPALAILASGLLFGFGRAPRGGLPPPAPPPPPAGGGGGPGGGASTSITCTGSPRPTPAASRS